MSKISNMSMAEIFETVDVKFELNDMNKICSNKEVCDRICELIMAGKDYHEVMIDNEEYIDKENLLIVIWLWHKKELKENQRKMLNPSFSKKSINKSLLEQEIRDLKNNMQKIKKLCRDMDAYLTTIHQKDNIAEKLIIVSSKEEILGFDFSEKEKNNRKLFDYIDKNLVGENDENGMKYALQTIEIDDLEKVLPHDIAKAAEYKITNNSLVCGKEYIDKYNEKESKGEETSEIDAEYKINILLPEIRATIEQLLKYVDLEKLLLIQIHNLEQGLDSAYSDYKSFPNEKLRAVNTVCTFLAKIIKKDTVIEDEKGIYSYNDAQNFIDRIDTEKNMYITSEEEKTLKTQLLEGMDLKEASDETIIKAEMLKYTKDELDTIMANGTKSGFELCMIMQELSEEQIIEMAYQYKDKWSDDLTKYFYSEGLLSIKSIIKLYSDGIVNAEFIKEFSSENDISEEFNLQKINEKYLALKNQKEPKQEEVEQLDRLIELYKLINIQEKTPEELEAISDSVMYEIAEDFEDADDIIFYYEKGLLSLETVADWVGDESIEELYNKSKITFEDLESLYKSNKISKELIQRKIQIENMDYNTLIANIMNGYVSEDKIIDLYMHGKIFENHFKEIYLEGKIRTDKYYEATSKRSKEVLEENSEIKFKPVLYNIPDKKIKINAIDDNRNNHNSTGYGASCRTKTLIDPNIRYELLKLLGAKEAEPYDLAEDNAFYNYEFFVIPDSQGNVQGNSVVIAERFYEDKETQYRFATDNATYFFQYNDLMVNSNLSKKDMVQNRQNIVFTANHRAGSWAVSVLYKIAETMAGEDFKRYKKGDERAEKLLDEFEKIYSPKQIKEIIDLVGRIDNTNEFIYEEVTSAFRKSTRNNGEER